MKGLRDQKTWTMKNVMGPSRDGSGLEVSLGPRMMFDQVESWRYKFSLLARALHYISLYVFQSISFRYSNYSFVKHVCRGPALFPRQSVTPK